MGFDTFKWRPGTDWEEAGITATTLGETVCRKLRAAVGPGFRLGLEKKAWDAWTLEQCLEIAPIINDLGFFFFEQPMMDLGGAAQFADYRRIKALMPKVMLWGGEGLRTREQVRPWVEQHIYDAIQCDCIWTGVTENWYIARLAAAHGVKVVPHNWTSALGTMCNTHLVAASPSGFMCEFFLYEHTPWREVLFKEPLVPQNGVITLSDKPGFGVELVDIETLKARFPYDPAAAGLAANPRFPHAWARAQAREQAVIAQYRG
jgi:L-alanine-DL-glutamate epimerase-like enolase superfamily enzyme